MSTILTHSGGKLKPSTQPSPRGKKSIKQRGFTLIELSIVLVIIGLIVGGVMVGRDIIEGAKMRQQFSQIEQFNTTANTFKLKYNCLPGDCANATNFFPQASGCPYSSPVNTGDETCNGNGNGRVYRRDADGGWATTFYESPRFWQQLGSAGLIANKYSGISAYPDPPIYYGYTPGLNVPVPAIDPNLIISIQSLGNTHCGGNACYGQTISYDNVFILGGNTRYSPSPTLIFNAGGMGPGLTAQQARIFDTKFDDGLPAFGNITAGPSNGWNFSQYCTNEGGSGGWSMNPTTATYSINYVPVACQLYFKAAF